MPASSTRAVAGLLSPTAKAWLHEHTAETSSAHAGVKGDERFHAAVTAAGHSALLERLMAEIRDLVQETRIESLSQPVRPAQSLLGHRRIAEAIDVAMRPRRRRP